jgi:hypothetical protein
MIEKSYKNNTNIKINAPTSNNLNVNNDMFNFDNKPLAHPSFQGFNNNIHIKKNLEMQSASPITSNSLNNSSNNIKENNNKQNNFNFNNLENNNNNNNLFNSSTAYPSFNNAESNFNFDNKFQQFNNPSPILHPSSSSNQNYMNSINAPQTQNLQNNHQNIHQNNSQNNPQNNLQNNFNNPNVSNQVKLNTEFEFEDGFGDFKTDAFKDFAEKKGDDAFKNGDFGNPRWDF